MRFPPTLLLLRVYVKLVNTADTAQPVHIALTGAWSVSPTGPAWTLSDADLPDINTITEPTKIVPKTAPVSEISRDFTYTAAPDSVTVLQMQTRQEEKHYDFETAHSHSRHLRGGCPARVPGGGAPVVRLDQ